jgi:hypothetical protein
MTNVKTEMKNNLLIITVDISRETINKSGFSKAGKNKLVGSTHGFVGLDNGIGLSLNVTGK